MGSLTSRSTTSPLPALVILILYLFCALSISSTAGAAFKCNSGATCDAIVDYVLPNTTTLHHIKTLFNVRNLRSILGVNNLSLSTLPNFTLPATTTVKIPFPCICTNGTGKSNKRPMYKVVKDDGLYHIAAEVFSGLVTFQEIQAVNNIPDAKLIKVGQELWIPLPCSCDDVDGQSVVHYGHVVANGSTVEGIAQQFGTSQDTLLRLNGLASPNDLKADSILDVPLKACTSTVNNNSSLDYPLLVANGTSVFTATNCVMCKCDAANNWTLQCEPTQLKSSLWKSCPSMQCQGAESLNIGNSTSSNCNRTSCTYAGYSNQTILTALVSESTCPVPGDSSSGIGQQSWRWNSFWILFQLLFCLYKFL